MVGLGAGVALAFTGLGPAKAHWGHPLAQAGAIIGVFAVLLGLITLRSIRREPRFTGARSAQVGVVLGLVPLVLLSTLALTPGTSLRHVGSPAVGSWGYSDAEGKYIAGRPLVEFSAEGRVSVYTGRDCNSRAGRWDEEPGGVIRTSVIKTLMHCPHDPGSWMGDNWDHMRVKGVWLVVYDEAGREMGRLPRVAM